MKHLGGAAKYLVSGSYETLAEAKMCLKARCQVDQFIVSGKDVLMVSRKTVQIQKHDGSWKIGKM